MSTLSTAAPLLGSARVRLAYWWRHRRLLDLAEPRLFTEWVQHRKLYDRDHRLPPLADKVAVKAFVAARRAPDWVTPTLWHGLTPPALPPAPAPLVLKARHGCGQVAIVRTEADWPAAVRRSRRWTRDRYGYWLDEWAYAHIPRGLLIEPYLGHPDVLPTDYKCYVFGGRAEFVEVHLDRGGDHRWIVMDRDWTRMSSATRDPDPVRPAMLARMLAGAEALARGYDFLRVDFYEIAGQPRFGELTLYPGSGLLRVHPPALDRTMGDHWRRARLARASPLARNA